MIENWDQYKDLEYYPDRVCKCGCGGRIKVHFMHKYHGIPVYVKGHHRKGIKDKSMQGDNNPAKSPEARKKISIAKIKDHKEHPERTRGENNPNWRGGISKESYPFEFNNELKELIKDRDSHTCQLCDEVESELVIHHIDYIKKNLNRDNLITLCRSCNGKVNFNRGWWKEYFMFLRKEKVLK